MGRSNVLLSPRTVRSNERYLLVADLGCWSSYIVKGKKRKKDWVIGGRKPAWFMTFAHALRLVEEKSTGSRYDFAAIHVNGAIDK